MIKLLHIPGKKSRLPPEAFVLSKQTKNRIPGNRDNLISSLLKGFIDLVYPKVCLVCKSSLKETASQNYVCQDCFGKIKYNLPPFCTRCGRQLARISSLKNICIHCLKRTVHYDRVFCPCVYEGTLKALIHEFKYTGKQYLGALLSKPLVDFIREYNVPIENIDYIVPMPLHSSRLRERGFNQAEILSRHVALAFGKQVLNDNLKRQRATKTQTDLEPSERIVNVQGSFAVKDASVLQGKNILLIDDVFTTGATSSEAAATLKQAKANMVFVLTLAN